MQITPKYAITVQGRKMPLHFEMLDLYAAAGKFGQEVDILNNASAFWTEWSPGRQLPYMICVGLNRSMPEVTPDWVYDHISWEDADVFPTITAALADFSRRLQTKAAMLAEKTMAEAMIESSTDGLASGLQPATISD